MAQRKLTLEDARQVKYPSDPRLSPDGRQVAYELDGQLYVVPTAGGSTRAVTAAGSKASNAHWSRDGTALYFLSDRSGKNQLWKLPVATFGEAIQLTKFEHGVETLSLSGDESRLLLDFTEDELRVAADDKAADGQPAPPFVITRLEFKEDSGDGYLTGDRARHLYALELATGKLTQLTSGQFTESDAAWSPDGRSVVFVSNREQQPDASYKTDLWLVSADNTDKGQALTRLTSDDRVKSAPQWSAEGRSIAFLTAEDGVYGAPQLAVIPASGGAARILTSELDRWVNSFVFSADGEWIYFLYEHEGGTRLGRVRPRDGKLERVFDGEQYIWSVDVGRSGAITAARRGRQRRPGAPCVRQRSAETADERQRCLPRHGQAGQQGAGVVQESRRHGGPGVRDQAA